MNLARAWLGILAGLAVVAAGAAQEPIATPGPLAPILQGLVDRHVIAGAVALVADADRVLDLEAVGVSSMTTKTPMKTDALFWIASMTKSMTGTGLMMLVDEGRLTLDDPVEKYLPEFQGQTVSEGEALPHPPRHPITIREVMDHTSGLVVMNDPKFKQTPSLQENVARFAALPLRREPGTKYEYNNAGIMTGARVVEVITEIPYAEYMQQRLFTPLGMTETSFWPDEELAKRLVSTVKFTPEKTRLEDIHLDPGLTPERVTKASRGVPIPASMLANFGGSAIGIYTEHYADPAGGVYSTASDVGRFCQMLLHGGSWKGRRYLSEPALKQMTAIQTGEVPVNPQEGYGVGWSVKTNDAEGPAIGSFGHRGARKTMMWIDPTHRLAMVLMVQCWDITGDQGKDLYQSFLKAAVAQFGSRPEDN